MLTDPDAEFEYHKDVQNQIDAMYNNKPITEQQYFNESRLFGYQDVNLDTITKCTQQITIAGYSEFDPGENIKKTHFF